MVVFDTSLCSECLWSWTEVDISFAKQFPGEDLANLHLQLQKHEEETTQQLSLSEWRVWQDRPFPTSMVDHSDRCYHFISIMKMIDEMRCEQVRCSPGCRQARGFKAQLEYFKSSECSSSAWSAARQSGEVFVWGEIGHCEKDNVYLIVFQNVSCWFSVILCHFLPSFP